MYFRKVEINNYGCISNFKYQFRFDSNGNPIPCVLIGENGKGKTLLIANMVDSMIELKRTVFGNRLQETFQDNYYKIGNKNYINSNSSYSRVLIEIDCGGQINKYYDIMSRNPQYDLPMLQESELLNIDEFKETGYSKKTESHLKRDDFLKTVSLYFPADRYYVPMWQNKDNQNIYRDTTTNDINKSKTNLIKTNLLNEIHEWTTDIFLDRVVQEVFLNNDSNLPEEYRGKTFYINKETPMQELILKIISVVKGFHITSKNCTNRKSKMLGFSSHNTYCSDISQLSEGEINLVGIALSIVKEWDINHENVDLSEIIGTVIIDEADIGLHIDYAYRALPQLMKLFPRVQFILTSHSPFFLSGLKKEYGDNVDIISMPDGLKITDISSFEEMKKAQNLFNASVEELRKDKENLIKEIEGIKAKTGKVLIYTEGETDVILLKKAYEKLGISNLNNIEFYAASDKNNGHNNDAVTSLLDSIRLNNLGLDNVVVGMYDRDVVINLTCDNNISKEINGEKYVRLADKLYAFVIPVPHNRNEENQISIEHYFTDEEIKTTNEEGQRLFMGNEFWDTGNYIDDSQDFYYKCPGKLKGTIKIIEHEQKKYVTNRRGDGDYSLSKKHFAESVRDERPKFENFDFSEFKKIFDIIKEIADSEGF